MFRSIDTVVVSKRITDLIPKPSSVNLDRKKGAEAKTLNRKSLAPMGGGLSKITGVLIRWLKR